MIAVTGEEKIEGFIYPIKCFSLEVPHFTSVTVPWWKLVTWSHPTQGGWEVRVSIYLEWEETLMILVSSKNVYYKTYLLKAFQFVCWKCSMLNFSFACPRESAIKYIVFSFYTPWRGAELFISVRHRLGTESPKPHSVEGRNREQWAKTLAFNDRVLGKKQLPTVKRKYQRCVFQSRL